MQPFESEHSPQIRKTWLSHGQFSESRSLFGRVQESGAPNVHPKMGTHAKPPNGVSELIGVPCQAVQRQGLQGQDSAGRQRRAPLLAVWEAVVAASLRDELAVQRNGRVAPNVRNMEAAIGAKNPKPHKLRATLISKFF